MIVKARFVAFAENYEYIERENAQGHSYKLGLNEFSDMSMDEFKMSKLGMRLPSESESVWGNIPSGGMHKVSNSTLPKSVDWRSKAVTPVKNQQQCGSCAMFGSQTRFFWHNAVGLVLGFNVFFCTSTTCLVSIVKSETESVESVVARFVLFSLDLNASFCCISLAVRRLGIQHHRSIGGCMGHRHWQAGVSF